MRIRLLLLPILAAAVAIATVDSAGAQDATSAKQFLQSVYQNYGHGGHGINTSGPKAARYFHSSLIALIKADQKAAGPDDEPVLDGDPVCGCQDWDGIFDLKIDMSAESPERAVANVSFSLFKGGKSGDARRLQITVVPENGQWRIWDVVDLSDPKAPFALRKELTDEIAQEDKAKKNSTAK